MKRTYIILATFTVVAFTVGCKPTNPPPEEELAPSAAETQLEQAKQETKEALVATKEYAYAQKQEFVTAMKAELATLNQQMDELGAKIEKTTGDAKEEAKAKYEALKQKSTGLTQKLDEVGNATESTWEDVKGGFKTAYEETKKSFNDVRAWLAEKIAP